MPYSCCCGKVSSHSFGGYLRYPGTSCGSSYPSNLVYRTDLCSPSTCQLGSSLYSGCQETYSEPTSCQTSCYRPRTSPLCSPCQTTYSESLGFGSSSCRSLGCGPNGFRPLGCGGCSFPSLSCASGFYRPSYLASRSCWSSCYRPTCGSHFYRFTC
uniref:Keratin-associated protein n=1 Tax=Propithecus coquereli TaxID=379532 RepID=A0A2K6G849_PROCO